MKKYLLLVYVIFLSTAAAHSQGYKPGDKAEAFTLKNVDGSMVSLTGKEASKGAIVVFTCNHCPFAKLYEDRINELNIKYAPKGYPVLAINSNDPSEYEEDSYDNMKIRAKEKRFTFPYLLDDTQKIAKAYGATKTPHVYVLSRSGDDFKVEYIGAIDDNSKSAKDVNVKYVENALTSLMEGKKPAVTSTKAIGCSIKWK